MSKITALYLGCEVNDRLWVPVRKMVWQDEQYRVGYVGGVKQIAPAGSPWRHYFKPEGFEQVKRLTEVHCDFAPRMPLDRPQEMKWYLPSLGLPEDLEDPLGNPAGTEIAFVARTGGYRHTDTLDAFPEVEPDADGCYRFYFLLRKLHLIQPDFLDIVKVRDSIKPSDWWAIHQGTGNKVGILPGYIRSLTIEHPKSVAIKIEQINSDATLQDRLLCSATCKDFVPFVTEEYLPIGDF
jgi:hypothetical protein